MALPRHPIWQVLPQSTAIMNETTQRASKAPRPMTAHSAISMALVVVLVRRRGTSNTSMVRAQVRQRTQAVVKIRAAAIMVVRLIMPLLMADLRSDRPSRVSRTKHLPTSPLTRSAMEGMQAVTPDLTENANSTRPR